MIYVTRYHYEGEIMALETITGEIPDITKYIEFGIYNWVVYKSNT